MRNTAFMLLLCCCISAAASGQGINISAKNESLEKVFSQLEKQSGYTFFYKIELVRTLPKVTVDVKHGTLIGALTQVLQNQSTLTWKIVGRTVVISKAETPPPSTADQKANLLLVTGRVVDRDGQGIPNVSISLKGTQYAWKTNPDGVFTSALLEGSQGPGKPLVLAFSSIGFAPKEMKVDGQGKNLIVTLREQVNTLDEVQMTAYSKTSKRYNVGDITTINSDEIARNPVPNV
ncbi:MAG: carboxypeptidase-like regulatory domain-containing protein, partial [Chitinophaga rupis]